ncbi:MAG: kynureninase [Croceibacterium sp.]
MAGPLPDCEALDAADPLARFRDRFVLPEGVTYLDGNSLGALPRATSARLAAVVEQEWGEGLIRSWNAAGWIDAPHRVGAKIARLIGAAEDEVVVADSTSVNIYKLLCAALAADPRRTVLLTEPDNFPTDLYIAQGIAEACPGVTVRTLPRDAILDALGPSTVLLLTHVHYKSGARFDMAAVERRAAEVGAVVVWDLSHSAGGLQLDLAGDRAQLAAGCGYKYLNGGPGAPAFLYVARALQSQLISPLTGWMGHAAPFAFSDRYEPAAGLARFLCGTPPILGLAALECGVDIVLEAGIEALAHKGRALGDRFIAEVAACCPGLELASPRDATARGNHVSFRHPHGYEVAQALIARGVIGDFRDPDLVRFGFAPLYTRFADVRHAAQTLGEVLARELWREPRFAERASVT